MKTLLWLDDIRNPYKDNWVKDFSPLGIEYPLVYWVKDYGGFCTYIKANGLPDGICFDHDLGLPNHFKRINGGMSKTQSKKLKPLEKTGYDCAKWLVDYCLDRKLPLPLYNIQSSNPAGKENIDALLKNYIKYYNK